MEKLTKLVEKLKEKSRFCLSRSAYCHIILPLKILGLPYQTAMKQQQQHSRAADDQFHHTAISQRKVVLFVGLDRRTEE